jgi:hypothetical protein
MTKGRENLCRKWEERDKQGETAERNQATQRCSFAVVLFQNATEGTYDGFWHIASSQCLLSLFVLFAGLGHIILETNSESALK